MKSGNNNRDHTLLRKGRLHSLPAALQQRLRTRLTARMFDCDAWISILLSFSSDVPFR
jgi:hypothetical protein